MHHLLYNKVLTILAQKHVGKLWTLSMFLTISWRDWFIRSTIPFFCGVYRAENLWAIPSSSQKFSNSSFTNSLSWSFLILKTINLFHFEFFYEVLKNVLRPHLSSTKWNPSEPSEVINKLEYIFFYLNYKF